jgi:hypothetical protein
MKHLSLLCVALSVLVLAGAILYHAKTLSDTAIIKAAAAQTGRYQISSVAGLTGVYRIDTGTGKISICSAAYPDGCITIEQAHANIQQQRENAMEAAKGASDRIDQFTKDRAKKLRSVIDKLTPDEPPAIQDDADTKAE